MTEVTADPAWTLAAWESGCRETPLDRAVTLLAAVTGGLRALLLARGTPTDGLNLYGVAAAHAFGLPMITSVIETDRAEPEE